MTTNSIKRAALNTLAIIAIGGGIGALLAGNALRQAEVEQQQPQSLQGVSIKTCSLQAAVEIAVQQGHADMTDCSDLQP